MTRRRSRLTVGLVLVLVAVLGTVYWRLQPSASSVSSQPAEPLCPAGTTAGPAAPADGDVTIGVQFHATWDAYTDKTRARIVDLVAQAGIQWVRIDVGWRSVEPDRRGRWDQEQLSRVDRSVDLARERGMSVMITLLDSPTWAGGGEDGRALPSKPADYASAIGFLAERYAGRVDAWEVWNEPNSDSFTSDGNPAAYADLLRAAYPSVKAAAPDALVVFGGVQYNDDAFVAGAYDAGAGGFFDVMATHPYPSPSDEPLSATDDGSIYSLGHIDAIRQLMVENGDEDLPVWFTEIGWSTHENSGSEQGYERGVSAERQADYLLQAMDLIEQKFPYVQQVDWYTDRDQEVGEVQNDNFGLLTTGLAPKPALRRLACRLVGVSG